MMSGKEKIVTAILFLTVLMLAAYWYAPLFLKASLTGINQGEYLQFTEEGNREGNATAKFYINDQQKIIFVQPVLGIPQEDIILSIDEGTNPDETDPGGLGTVSFVQNIQIKNATSEGVQLAPDRVSLSWDTQNGNLELTDVKDGETYTITLEVTRIGSNQEDTIDLVIHVPNIAATQSFVPDGNTDNSTALATPSIAGIDVRTTYKRVRASDWDVTFLFNYAHNQEPVLFNLISFILEIDVISGSTSGFEVYQDPGTSGGFAPHSTFRLIDSSGSEILANTLNRASNCNRLSGSCSLSNPDQLDSILNSRFKGFRLKLSDSQILSLGQNNLKLRNLGLILEQRNQNSSQPPITEFVVSGASAFEMQAINNRPVHITKSLTRPAGVQISLPADLFTQNNSGGDVDPDGDLVMYNFTSLPATGTLQTRSTVITATNIPFTFHPSSVVLYQSSTVGTSSFDFMMNDGLGDSTSASTITITLTNTPPEATADSYTVKEGETLEAGGSGNPPKVLANDPPDENGHLITAVLDTPPAGQFNFKRDGSFTYTPATNHNGHDLFTYHTNDGQPSDSDSPTVEVNITIRPANETPIANNDGISYSENDPPNTNYIKTNDQVSKTVNVLANDSDPDGDNNHLTVSLPTQPPSNVLAQVNQDNSLTITPNLNLKITEMGGVPREVTVLYRITDQGTPEREATAEIKILVYPKGDYDYNMAFEESDIDKMLEAMQQHQQPNGTKNPQDLALFDFTTEDGDNEINFFDLTEILFLRNLNPATSQ